MMSLTLIWNIITFLLSVPFKILAMAILGHGHLFKASVSLDPGQFQSTFEAFQTMPPTTAKWTDAAQIPLSPDSDVWTMTHWQHLHLHAIRHYKRLFSNYQHEFLVLEISSPPESPSHSDSDVRVQIRVTVQRDIEDNLKTSITRTIGVPKDCVVIFPSTGTLDLFDQYMRGATTVDQVSWAAESPSVASVLCLLGIISRIRNAYTTKYNCFWLCATVMCAVRRISPAGQTNQGLVHSWLQYQLRSTFIGVRVNSGSVAEDAASAIRQLRNIPGLTMTTP